MLYQYKSGNPALNAFKANPIFRTDNNNNEWRCAGLPDVVHLHTKIPKFGESWKAF
jgi:hypothetical protein